MTWFDFAATLIVALAVFDGARNGAAWAALEAVLFTVSAVVARAFGPELEPYVAKVADLEPADLASTAHLVVFVGAAALSAGALILVHPAAKRWRFRHDRWAGGVLAAATGLFAAVVLFSIVIWARPRPTAEDAIAESRILSVLRCVSDSAVRVTLPRHVPARLVQLDRP